MRRWRWIVGALFVAAGAVAVCQLGGGEPEDKLAANLDKLSRIMLDNVRTPKKGVTRVFDYNRDHIAEMLARWGEIIADLDRIENDKQREKRGRHIVKVLRPALERAGQAAERFFEAVSRDPEAQRELERRLARLKPLEELFRSLARQLSALARPPR
jgi:DNA repair ATPase RecN